MGKKKTAKDGKNSKKITKRLQTKEKPKGKSEPTRRKRKRAETKKIVQGKDVKKRKINNDKKSGKKKIAR